MPQFDISSFFNQIIWLSIFFSSFYLVLLCYILPLIVASLKSRYKKEKFEFSIPYQKITSVNKTDLSVTFNKKHLLVKDMPVFNSAL